MTAAAAHAPALPGSRVKCQRCPASVVWVKTEAKGKSMPLDPVPSRDGNVVLVPLPQSRHFVARVLTGDQLPPADGAPTYLSHFVTCRAGRPQRDTRVEKSCLACSWAIEAKSAKSARTAWSLHWEAEHANRCPGCNARLRPIRATTGDLIWLDPEPVDDGDQVLVTGALVTGEHQLLARHVERDGLLDTIPAYRVHECEGAGRG